MGNIDAFILIGGKSSRLGADKAFVDLDGTPLIRRTVETVRKGLAPDRLIAVAGNAAQFAIEAIVAEVPFTFDLYENRGPLGGLHAALVDARTPWIFAIACDYPFVSPELICLLSEAISDECGCVVPEQSDGRLQPLCAFYNVAAAKAIVEEILERPRVPPPLHEVVESLKPRIVRFEEYAHLDGVDQLFININTAADLDQAYKIARKLSPPR